jgi:hypothetical protein
MNNDPYDFRYNEFEIQAEAYSLLRAAGYLVRGEFTFRNKNPPYWHETKQRMVRGRGGRFDLVILDQENEILLIIEVKKYAQGKGNSRGTYYELLTGKPCIYVRGMEEAENVVETVRKIIEAS